MNSVPMKAARPFSDQSTLRINRPKTSEMMPLSRKIHQFRATTSASSASNTSRVLSGFSSMSRRVYAAGRLVVAEEGEGVVEEQGDGGERSRHVGQGGSRQHALHAGALVDADDPQLPKLDARTARRVELDGQRHDVEEDGDGVNKECEGDEVEGVQDHAEHQQPDPGVRREGDGGV